MMTITIQLNEKPNIILLILYFSLKFLGGISGMSVEKLKDPNMAILVTIVLTVIVAIESLYFVPWAPYFLIYSALAIIIPLYTKSYKFGRITEIFKDEKLKFFIVALIAAFAYSLIMDNLYALILESSGLKNNPYFDLNAALVELATAAGLKFGISTFDAILIYAIYVIIWAPIGEELLYRGYLYGEMKKKYGILVSTIVSTFFFGIRHTVHFLMLPNFPLVSALYWALHAFIFGLIMVYAYEKTDTLYAPMIIHFLANLLL